jgi:hypothetical protein
VRSDILATPEEIAATAPRRASHPGEIQHQKVRTSPPPRAWRRHQARSERPGESRAPDAIDAVGDVLGFQGLSATG